MITLAPQDKLWYPVSMRFYEKGVLLMLEKFYHRINGAGAAGIVCGVISIITGVTVGVIMIVSSGKLLASRKDMEL